MRVSGSKKHKGWSVTHTYCDHLIHFLYRIDGNSRSELVRQIPTTLSVLANMSLHSIGQLVPHNASLARLLKRDMYLENLKELTFE